MEAKLRLAMVQVMIQYTFNDCALLREALQAAQNTRLARIGVAALTLLLATEGYQRRQPESKSIYQYVIDQVIARRTDNTFVAQKAFTLGLNRYIDDPSQGGYTSHDVMATTVQAILGAVQVDSGGRMMYLEEVVDLVGVSWPVGHDAGSGEDSA
ncbi:hypothetical protein BJX96DRAFT_177259 [Aspergillus floccosus]